MFSHEYIIWICVFAYAVHILEEFILNWRDWAESAIGLKNLSWPIFYVVNSGVIVTGISSAMVGWHAPVFALIIPALQLINGIFFHILPTVKQRRFSPGVITATILFLPIASWAYVGAYLDHMLSIQTVALSFVFGGLLMSTPIIFLTIKEKYNL